MENNSYGWLVLTFPITYHLGSNIGTFVQSRKLPLKMRLTEWIFRYPGCKFTAGKGSNLTHKKMPRGYEYQFHLKVNVSCGNEQGTFACNFVTTISYGDSGSEYTYMFPCYPNTFPNIGPKKENY